MLMRRLRDCRSTCGRTLLDGACYRERHLGLASKHLRLGRLDGSAPEEAEQANRKPEELHEECGEIKLGEEREQNQGSTERVRDEIGEGIARDSLELQQQVGTDNKDDARCACKIMKSHVALVGSRSWNGQSPRLMVC
jgi:hypothetical protein